ncbi:glycoside hydrolase family 28 protein [Bacteroides ilei]|uniref:glycoside hydrolase family 28 protein n=1 Tax=Bacteroides ilei TaxID=1907658 RepID=UPI00373FD91E
MAISDTDRTARRDSILSQITGADIPQATIDITSLGAIGNGEKDCKPAFDKAMKKAVRTGGLHIIVPAGEYLLNGPIHFTSNVCLELQDGATLKFSPEPKYYLPLVKTSWEGTFIQNYSPFIYGYQVENISIIGKGTIDGNAGSSFATWKSMQKKGQQLTRDMNHNETPVSERNFGEGYFLRPQLIQLFECRNITIEGVFITNSPFWCIHLLKSENIICRDIRYDAKLVNNDGIDPEYTRNLLIENITFNNGDDNIAIKCGRDNDGWKTNCPSENIIIRNCKFKGLHGVVLGSEMSAGIQNIFIENCTYGGYCKRGIYIKTNPDRGGFIRNIYINNCKFGNVEDLFYATSMYAGEGLDNNHFTEVHDIHVKDLSCNTASSAGIVLQGTTTRPIYNVSFENVNIGKTSIGLSFTNTEYIQLKNCNLGGVVGIPSTVSDKDNIFNKK